MGGDQSIVQPVLLDSLAGLLHQNETHIGTVSHELKSMLTSVKAYEQLLERRLSPDNDPNSYTYLQKMDHHIDTLAESLTDLFDAIRIQAGVFSLHRTQWNFMEIVDEMRAYVRLNHRQLYVHGSISQDMYADKHKIARTMQHLIKNALTYSENTSPIEIYLRESDGKIQCDVKDFGRGISEMDGKYVFEPFSRGANASGKGLGIGLYYARSVIKLHSGSIMLSETSPTGSTFSLLLPCNLEQR